MERRTFLKGLVGAAALTLVPMLDSEPEKRFILYGDGIHDDQPALQAIFNGDIEDVEVRNNKVRVNEWGGVDLSGGTYRLDDTIDLSNTRNSSITGCRFTHGASDGKPVMIVDSRVRRLVGPA